MFKQRTPTEKKSLSKDITEALLIFRSNLKKLGHYLQRHQKQIGHKKPNLQWFLLAGPEDSGKTTLLNQAPIAENQALLDNGNDQHIWIADQNILFDLPGKFLEPNHASLHAWKLLMEDIKRARAGKGVDAIILAIDASSLLTLSSQQQEGLITNIQHMLEACSYKAATPLAVYVLLTQSDRIAGFSEFFSDLDEKQRAQIFGISLPPKIASRDFVDFFNNEYRQLLKCIHQQLIARLHRERNQAKRSILKDYPVQMEILGNKLSEFAFAIHAHKRPKINCHIHGYYFTSNATSHIPLDCLTKPINQAFEVQVTPPEPLDLLPKPYFIKQLFADLILPNYPIMKPNLWLLKAKVLLRRSSYALIVLITIGSTILIADVYNKEMTYLNSAEHALEKYQFLAQQTTPHKRQHLLAELDALAQANQILQKTQSINLTLFKKADLKTKASQAYQHLLQTRLLSLIAQDLELQLQAAMQQPSSELYALFKTYLMLGNPQYLDKQFAEQWIEFTWLNDSSITDAQLIALNKHLSYALNEPNSSLLTLNQELVSDIRQQLKSLPQPTIAYLALKNLHAIDPIHPLANSLDTIFVNSQKNLAVPSLYTQARFQEIYQQQAYDIGSAVIKGNWVLGEHANKPFTIKAKQQLIEQVRTLYLADYVNWWNLTLYNTHIKHFDQLQQLDYALTTLASKQSPLFNLLNIIAENTSTLNQNTPASAAFNQEVASKFAAINAIDAPELKHNIELLRNTIHHIITSKAPGETAFGVAKQFAEHPEQSPLNKLFEFAAKTPEPVQSWLNDLGTNAWKLIFYSAQQHINAVWQSEIYPEYQHTIANRYPIFKQAKQEIAQKDFVKFFGPEGIINNFFTKYLQPFTDTNPTQWQPKTVHGLRLNLSKELLQQFERAVIIQHMFFSNKQFSVNFRLKPIAFEPKVATMMLNINGQLLEDKPDSRELTNFAWPGEASNPEVTLEFTNSNGQHSSILRHGEWALFRILDHANLEVTKDTQHYRVSFKLNDSASQYELIVDNVINPFMPHIIDHFRIPEVLMTDESQQQLAANN
ncbi:MAG: type IVB secretion system protein IcmF [Gammaproteobacteria bacterium]